MNFLKSYQKITVWLLSLVAIVPCIQMAAQEPVRKIVMLSLPNCPGCKKMLPLLQQIAARSQGKIIVEVIMYDDAQALLKRFNVGHIDRVPHLLIIVDNVLVQQIPFSSSLSSADAIWNAINRSALKLV